MFVTSKYLMSRPSIFAEVDRDLGQISLTENYFSNIRFGGTAAGIRHDDCHLSNHFYFSF